MHAIADFDPRKPYVRIVTRLIVFVLLAVPACHRSLGPGETRCVSIPSGSVYITKCKSGPPVQAQDAGK